ncbi:hypothetical protein MYP_3064 [Sporocytophaga myxococcoides]|uniref:DoxX-like family protein n=2 Tax=Sporocytophaga myxococcoides TaxID=153721 RepID=A0A098LFT6_9BACT|nr:hypothetical protein MYP_3064 [Sporocytophaga myxococcoides]
MSLGMLSGGIAQLFQVKDAVDGVVRLGYPSYFPAIIGFWKILGVIAVLIPRFPLLKEWAYAGFFFCMSGALYTHIAVGDPAKESIGPVLLIILIVVSWYFRPAERRLISSIQ